MLGRTDQRSRLLNAIVGVVAQDGYAQAKVGEIAKLAGVSRASFYEQFTNKEECFLAAYREVADRISDEVKAAVAQSEGSGAAQAALGALAEFADKEPLAFNFLTHEGMLAGPRALEERDRLMSSLERVIERAWAQAPAGAPVLDMSAKLLLEGTVRLLGLSMRKQITSEGLGPDLLAWIDSYAVPARSPRWRELVPDPVLLRTLPDGPGAPALPRPLPKGKHGLRNTAVKGVQHERLVYASAEAIVARGYANVTVADIVASAGLSRDLFYTHFHDKEEAFEEAFKFVFEQLLASMAGAFFGSSSYWPDKIWEAGGAFARFLEADRTLAQFIVIGTHAPPPLIDHVNDSVRAFSLFLQDGYHHRPESAQVSRLVSEALVCAVLEAVTFNIRHDRIEDLRGLIPILVYMVLAPFLGTKDASEFVEAKIKAARAEAAEPLGALPQSAA